MSKLVSTSKINGYSNAFANIITNPSLSCACFCNRIQKATGKIPSKTSDGLTISQLRASKKGKRRLPENDSRFYRNKLLKGSGKDIIAIESSDDESSYRSLRGPTNLDNEFATTEDDDRKMPALTGTPGRKKIRKKEETPQPIRDVCLEAAHQSCLFQHSPKTTRALDKINDGLRLSSKDELSSSCCNRLTDIATFLPETDTQLNNLIEYTKRQLV